MSSLAAICMLMSATPLQPLPQTPDGPVEQTESRRKIFAAAIQQWSDEVAFAGRFQLRYVSYSNQSDAARATEGTPVAGSTAIATGFMAKDARRVRFDMLYNVAPTVKPATGSGARQKIEVTHWPVPSVRNEDVVIHHVPSWTADATAAVKSSQGNTVAIHQRDSLDLPRWCASPEHSLTATPLTPGGVMNRLLDPVLTAVDHRVVKPREVNYVLFDESHQGFDFVYEVNGREWRKRVKFFTGLDTPVVSEVSSFLQVDGKSLVHSAIVFADFQACTGGSVPRRTLRYTISMSQKAADNAPKQVMAQELEFDELREPIDDDFKIRVNAFAQIHGAKRKLNREGDDIILDPDDFKSEEIVALGEKITNNPGATPSTELRKGQGRLVLLLINLVLVVFVAIAINRRRTRGG